METTDELADSIVEDYGIVIEPSELARVKMFFSPGYVAARGDENYKKRLIRFVTLPAGSKERQEIVDEQARVKYPEGASDDALRAVEKEVREVSRHLYRDLYNRILAASVDAPVWDLDNVVDDDPEDSLVDLTGIELQARREALGFSQTAFADYLGIKQVTLSRWENGSTPPGKSVEGDLTFLEDCVTFLADLFVGRVADPEEFGEIAPLTEFFVDHIPDWFPESAQREGSIPSFSRIQDINDWLDIPLQIVRVAAARAAVWLRDNIGECPAILSHKQPVALHRTR